MAHRSRSHRGHLSSARMRCWKQRDGMSNWPASTVADFRDGKIRSYRTYFDDASLIEQIAGV